MDELRRIRARIVTPAKNNVPKADDAETQAASDRPDNAPPAKGAAPESETPDGTDDLADSLEVDNVNVLRQLLAAETRELLKTRHVRMHPIDRFFYFVATEEGQTERREAWIGKRNAIRRVYEVKRSKKDPTKVAHHQHLSFELTFTKLGDDWYAQIVPSWFYSFDGYRQSNWHDDLLSQQKRLEHNMSVRNQVRFIAYFLANTGGDDGLSFQSLVEFDFGDDTDDVADDDLLTSPNANERENAA